MTQDIEKNAAYPSKENDNNFLFHNAFFVLDSLHLEQAATKLYGYTVVGNQMIICEEELGEELPSEEGAYIYIQKSKDTIRIMQDYVGSFGLYLFRKNDYFALSNSFPLLVDYLKKDHKLSFNRDYADHFLIIDLCSVAYSQTLIQEIQMLDRCAICEIDIPRRKLQIRMKDYHENTVNLTTQQGMQMLDAWFCKWTKRILSYSEQGYSIKTDLSGGFDSRLILSLFLSSGIDLNEILIYSMDDKLHTHEEDFEIASAISKKYGFKLNQNYPQAKSLTEYTCQDTMNLSLYSKLGFHKQMHWVESACTPMYLIFSGSGGECVRSYRNMSVSEYINKTLSRANSFPASVRSRLINATKNILDDSYQQIIDKFKQFGRDISPRDLNLNISRETQCRNHFGKGNVETYLEGIVPLSPLLDPGLHKLKLKDENCDDDNLLMAIIFTRYQPGLLDFKFDSNHSISESTIAYARQINQRYPLALSPVSDDNDSTNFLKLSCKRKLPFVASDGALRHPEEKPLEQVPEQVHRAFASKRTRGTLSMFYPNDVYDCIADDIHSRQYHPLQGAYTALAISKAISDTHISESLQNIHIAAEMETFADNAADVSEESKTLQCHPLLKNYITARIDIKNSGSSDNDLEVLHLSDENAQVTKPAWLQKDGHGYIIQSLRGSLDIVCRCKYSGEFSLFLRGVDVRDVNGERIPIWIDYTKLTINDQVILAKTTAVSHDKRFKHAMKVQDGDVVLIHAAWEPHNEKAYPVRKL